MSCRPTQTTFQLDRGFRMRDPIDLRPIILFLWLLLAFVVAVVILVAFSSAQARAAEWQPLARQCAEEIEQQSRCTTACTNKTWPEVARCANFRLKRPLPQAVIERCISQTQQHRSAAAAELYGDPVAEVFACPGG